MSFMIVLKIWEQWCMCMIHKFLNAHILQVHACKFLPDRIYDLKKSWEITALKNSCLLAIKTKTPNQTTIVWNILALCFM